MVIDHFASNPHNFLTYRTPKPPIETFSAQSASQIQQCFNARLFCLPLFEEKILRNCARPQQAEEIRWARFSIVYSFRNMKTLVQQKTELIQKAIGSNFLYLARFLPRMGRSLVWRSGWLRVLQIKSSFGCRSSHRWLFQSTNYGTCRSSIETLNLSSLVGLWWEKWCISGTRWRIWVLRPVLETLLNSIGTVFTNNLIFVSKS
jgi:hypothetical protein